MNDVDVKSTLKEPLTDPWRNPDLSLDSARKIDQICRQFEQQWQAGQQPTIEPLLNGYEGLSRDALLRELLSLDIDFRRRAGQQVNRDDYLKRFPSDLAMIDLAIAETADVKTDIGDGFPPELTEHPRYRLIKLLGRGGMGAVYLAEHRVLHRQVAVKVIRREYLNRPEVVGRFRREAAAAARLHHPNIVTAYDAEGSGTTHFLAMEFVPGKELAKLVSENGPLGVTEACLYIRQAAQGLDHAHRHQMVHRDISPRNLMLADDGTVKVLDFGLAHFVSELQPNNELTESGTVLGSLDFMAPEQADDPRSADIRADIYSLGCTLYYLLAGRAPFADRGGMAKLKAHNSEQPTPIAKLRSDVPPVLVHVLKKMLAKKPADRYQTPAEVVDALAPLAGAEITPAASPTIAPRKRDRSSLAIACLVAAVGLGTLLFVLNSYGLMPWARSHGKPADASSSELDLGLKEAIYLQSHREQEQMHKSIARLTKLSEKYPQSADVFAALADAYNLCGDYGWDAEQDAFPKAKAAAQESLRLDPDCAKGHLALAFALHAYDFDWRQADVEYRRAVELEPNNATAHYWYAWLLCELRRPDEATKQILEAQKLSPVDLIVTDSVGSIHYYCREFSMAIEQHRHSLELDKDYRIAHYHLALTLAEINNRCDEALAELDLAGGSKEATDMLLIRAYILARNGRAAEARQSLAKAEQSTGDSKNLYHRALAWAALGEKDKAFDLLDQCVDHHVSMRTKVKVDPRLDNLRTDPRFEKIVKRVGFEE